MYFSKLCMGIIIEILIDIQFFMKLRFTLSFFSYMTANINYNQHG